MTATAPRHVLLVDDDPNLVLFLGDRLRRDGYRITTARSGREAMDRMRRFVERNRVRVA